MPFLLKEFIILIYENYFVDQIFEIYMPVERDSWGRAWRLFLSATFSRGKNRAVKRYIGEDNVGNRYYELQGTTYGRGTQVSRGYDPPERVPSPQQPSVEWASWLQRQRRFPPSDEEIRMNADGMQRIAEIQREESVNLERNAPKIETTGLGAADMEQKKNYPTDYEKVSGFEKAPGARKPDFSKDSKWNDG